MSAFTKFPVWIEHSGLPAYVSEKAKSPLAWMLFKKIAELDCSRNRTPGIVEISLADLAAITGMDETKIVQSVKKLRKTGTLRSFLPDNEEEEALFEIITPLETPIPWEEVREKTPELYALDDRDFRYATKSEGEASQKDLEGSESKLKEVVDLYLDNVSMKMNAFIVDELRLISARFDLPLIRKVFARARTREVQSLAWILKEIRVEQKAAGEKSRKPA